MVATLGSGRVESLADLLRAFNDQHCVEVAYKPVDNRLARSGFATFMQQMLARLLEQLRLQTRLPDGDRAVARFTDIVIQDGSSLAIKATLAERPSCRIPRRCATGWCWPIPIATGAPGRLRDHL